MEMEGELQLMREGPGGASEDEGSSSDDSSSSDFEDISSEDAAAVMRLEAELEQNPNLYDSHLQYIEVLRRCKMLQRLREARRAMHSLFPLAESLWLDWISDELEAVAAAEDIPAIELLFEAAVNDYLSIDLWEQYLEFVRDFDSEVVARTDAGVEKMRGLCERALTAGGLHASLGGRLWAAYREFEISLLEALPGDEEAVERVRSLFYRQLGVPLLNGPDTLEAWRQWEASLVGTVDAAAAVGPDLPPSVAANYAKAQTAADLRRPYEEAVAPSADHPADAALLGSYLAYLKVEAITGDPSRTQVVYERAVAAFPVTQYLWLQYLRYLEAELKVPGVVTAAHARAVRNCPWVGEIWARALRALERVGAPEEEQAVMYLRATSAGLQGAEDLIAVVLARADALRRRGNIETLRKHFAAARDLLAARYPRGANPTLYLTRYWARCEERLGGEGGPVAAKAVWEAALKGPEGRLAEAWIEYAEFERAAGRIREARGVYKRAYARKLEGLGGGQTAVCEAWLMLEREEGSAEDHLAACLKAEPVLAAAAAERAAAGDAPGTVGARAAPRAGLPRREQAKEVRQAGVGKKRAGTVADGEGKGREAATGEQQVTKRPRPAQIADRQTVPANGDNTAAAPVPAAAATAAAPAHRFTVFIKYIDASVDEAMLRPLLDPCGAIASFRMARDPATGRHKGFAYVDYEEESGLKRAVEELDGCELAGKRLSVAESKPPEKATGGRGRGRGRGDGGRGVRGTDRGRGSDSEVRGKRGTVDLGGSNGTAGASGTAGGSVPPPKPLLVPRAAALRHGDMSAVAPLSSNAEFRRQLLLGKGKAAEPQGGGG